MSETLSDPLDGRRIISGTRGKTSTLLCKIGESAEDCAARHRAAGWDVPPGFKLGKDDAGRTLLEW